MEKIIQIEYQGRNFSIEESAYQIFQQYELDLKQFFSKEEEGDEIFADLQYRMSEILEQRCGQQTIYKKDIEALIEMIGKPIDFETNDTGNEKKSTLYTSLKKKLFRDKKDKIIAGVCSGIANYFSIDPIIVRLIFILFTIFNIVTFLSFNIGILAYILFWVILTPAILEPNVSKKLFRNPKDKILGGVCSGIAQFFNIETWIVRLLFLSPILLGFLSNHSNFSFVNVELISHSFYVLSIVSYILLWFIIPMAKVTTDYMLLKGEPININTIQNTTTMQDLTNKNNNGLNKFFRVIAYFIIALIMLIMIPTAIGI
jgi:phage shock protein PspC (stress-responsive transcriptional regulator)